MSKVGQRQATIIKFIQDHSEDSVKLKEIVDKFEHWYYYNGRHHIQEIMSRMVRSGKLVRPKRGSYSIPEVQPAGVNTNEVVDPNQTNIFEVLNDGK